MRLPDTVGKNIKIVCTDGKELQVKVLNYTSELDNEPDDDGNYGGAYINVQTLQSTDYFDAGAEFAVFENEIKNIKVID